MKGVLFPLARAGACKFLVFLLRSCFLYRSLVLLKVLADRNSKARQRQATIALQSVCVFFVSAGVLKVLTDRAAGSVKRSPDSDS